ncbi:MAG: hypothetical protein PWP52_2208 [Bacteroidales bacterium]|jgi:hypothetical protein|nr:hypothetical protein [Bacteroidales bacterium]
MPTGYQIKEQEAAYYLTFQVVFWFDIFTRKVYRDNIIIESLKYCQQEIMNLILVDFRWETVK